MSVGEYSWCDIVSNFQMTNFTQNWVIMIVTSMVECLPKV